MKGRKGLLAAAGVSCLLLFSVLLHVFGGSAVTDKFSGGETTEKSIEISENGGKETERQNSSSYGDIVVYVNGAVKKPGVYRVPDDTRVYQLLERAGGFTEDADKSAVNLAGRLKDGQQLNFPSCIETAQKGYRNGTRRNTSKKRSDGAYREYEKHPSDYGAKINVNTASHEELESVNGIGPKMASLIIDYRRENGNFSRLEDLLLVKGIGPKKYEKIRDRLTIGE
ncbi:MAG: ComEA family DNA-binding protein [Synergistaceae bacterium]|nr:ComEA family DNA-binding protein [Synergistaceae bacterium]